MLIAICIDHNLANQILFLRSCYNLQFDKNAYFSSNIRKVGSGTSHTPGPAHSHHTGLKFIRFSKYCYLRTCEKQVCDLELCIQTYDLRKNFSETLKLVKSKSVQIEL